MTPIVDRATEADTATKRMNAARRSRQKLIFERNVLLMIEARRWAGSHISPASAVKQTSAWKWVVCIHSPVGQIATHITADEADTIFADLKRTPSDWDGHTSDVKLLRLCELANMKGPR